MHINKILVWVFYFGIVIHMSGQVFETDTVLFHIEEYTLVKGDTTTIWVSTPAPMMLSGIQFGLVYDTADLNILDVSSPTIAKGDLRTKYDNKVFKFFIYNASGDVLSIKNQWLKITFLSQVTGPLSQYLHWASKFQSYIIDEDLNDFPLKITIGNTSGVKHIIRRDEVIFYPNPWEEELFIEVESNFKSRMQISLLALDGHNILETWAHRVGKGRYVVRHMGIVPSGVYFIRMEMPGRFVRTQKVVVK